MLFTNPVVLWGLFAISVPIIIHLFNLQRYKKVYFTNVRFLQQLQQQSKRQSVLRHWLALLFRILAIAFLVLAFAKPFIPSPLGTISETEGIASIYIDNSFSMETAGTRGLLIDEALTKAKDVVASHSRSDRFNLLTNDFLSIHHRMFAADETSSRIDEISISPAVRTLGEVLGRQYEMLNRENYSNKAAYLISDFQRNVADFTGFTADTSFRHYFLKLVPERFTNLCIDSCWFETPVQQPGQLVQLNLTISNHSGMDLEKVPVKLFLNGIQRALASFDIASESSTSGILSFVIRETGIHQGYIELSDFPITFDDRLFLSFNVLDAISVMSIYEQQPEPYLRTLFGSDTLFVYKEYNLKQLNYMEVSGQQLIILSGLNSIPSGLATELSRFVVNGGSLFVAPGNNIDRNSYNTWLQDLNTVVFSETDTSRMRVAELNLLHPLFKDVFETQPGNRSPITPETDLPWVNMRYKLNFPPRKDIQTVISLKDADPFLIADRHGEGKIYILSSPLDGKANTFPVHAIFVPVLYKMALLSTPYQNIYSIVGTRESINIGNLNPGNEQVFNLSGADGRLKLIPGHRTVNYNTHLYALDAIKTAGNYYLSSGQDTLRALSFNYDRRESVPDYLSTEELNDLAENAGITNFAVISQSDKPVGQLLSELSRGRQLWKYFLIAALAFLLAEVVVLRFLP